MIYILMIWTTIGFAGAGSQYNREFRVEKDWRPVAEFYSSHDAKAAELCEAAAKKLGVKDDRYRCVRSK